MLPFSTMRQVSPPPHLQPLQDEKPTAAINFAAGTIASVAATLATQPADVVRTHIQLGLSKPLPPGTRPLGGLRVIQNLVNAQGPSVLLAGALPRVCPRLTCAQEKMGDTAPVLGPR